ncbi:hypothetical protein N9200_00630 [Akkermansiaceae bacterium]|nr:hypothetical protein [Akkermansiaceae bacterium]
MSPEVRFYRVGNFFWRKKIPFLPTLFSYINRLLMGCWIPSTASIGKPFKTGYWGIGVVIHSKSIIGNNCLISQNVTIARNKKDPGVPRIGNNVVIGAGAVLVGDINIGDNVIIGANSFVNRNISSGVVAAGSPATEIGRVKSKELSDILGGLV